MKALLVFLLIASAVLAAEPPVGNSLADVIAEHGVTETLNTFGHASVRTAANLEGRSLSLDAAQRAAVWQALRKSKFTETRPEEPDAPYIFVVLNTGSSSHDRPVEEFWVDSQGLAHFGIDDDSPRRAVWVFRAPELKELLGSYLAKFGTPLR